ncbi:MAG: EVE domain-containing protein [candidate division Zixibacteria bacterium]|nr:EVE domain-containing protein [candidate division Zixibacteria bacterium]
MERNQAVPKRQFWLFKSEPREFSITDLENAPGHTTTWSGIRNYQARNLLRDQVQLGDQVFFYHSSTADKGIVGVCEITRTAHADPTALDPNSPYFEPRATTAEPIWLAVDVTLVHRFPVLIPLSILKSTDGLERMGVCRPGNRLSIQPVSADEWKIVLTLVKKLASRR